MEFESHIGPDILKSLFALRWSKVCGIIITILNICFSCPLLYFIIWFEKFGPYQHRTLVNYLAVSSCWVGIAYIVLLQTAELPLSLGVAFPKVFGYLYLLLKNTFAIQYTLLATSSSIVKYFYIFKGRNIAGQYDEFWVIFLNFIFICFGLISTGVLLILPGRNTYVFYLCCGMDSSTSGPAKINYSFNFSVAFLALVYIFVNTRIVIYKFYTLKRKVLPTTTNKPEPLQLLKNVLSNYLIIASLFFGTSLFIPVACYLNSLKLEEMIMDPNYHLIQWHQHLSPFLAIFCPTLVYFMTHKSLRESLYMEVRAAFSRQGNAST